MNRIQPTIMCTVKRSQIVDTPVPSSRNYFPLNEHLFKFEVVHKETAQASLYRREQTFKLGRMWSSSLLNGSPHIANGLLLAA